MVERNRGYWCPRIDLEKVYKAIFYARTKHIDKEQKLKEVLSFETTRGISFKIGSGGEHHLQYAYACFQDRKSFIDQDPQCFNFANNLNSVVYSI